MSRFDLWDGLVRMLTDLLDRPAYNFTGSNDTIYNAFVAPLAEFDITPTEVFVVA